MLRITELRLPLDHPEAALRSRLALLGLDAARLADKPFMPETLSELRAGAQIFDLSHKAFHSSGLPCIRALARITSPSGPPVSGPVAIIAAPGETVSDAELEMGLAAQIAARDPKQALQMAEDLPPEVVHDALAERRRK